MTNALEPRIRLVVDDITQLDVDAVVTAANQKLCGGGGVDGAVHRAAGPGLVAASQALAPCPSGSAKITPSFNLAAEFVIHAVGPVFSKLEKDAPTLASAYRSSLALAAENSVAHIAFPCISTGVYRFPKDKACEIAIDTVVEWLNNNALPEIVTFCCFEEQDAEMYREHLKRLGISFGE